MGWDYPRWTSTQYFLVIISIFIIIIIIIIIINIIIIIIIIITWHLIRAWNYLLLNHHLET